MLYARHSKMAVEIMNTEEKTKPFGPMMMTSKESECLATWPRSEIGMHVV
jgi:hypothetical protein